MKVRKLRSIIGRRRPESGGADQRYRRRVADAALGQGGCRRGRRGGGRRDGHRISADRPERGGVASTPGRP